MFDFNIWLDGLAVIAVFAAVGWLLSLPLRNAFFPGPPCAA